MTFSEKKTKKIIERAQFAPFVAISMFHRVPLRNVRNIHL